MTADPKKTRRMLDEIMDAFVRVADDAAREGARYGRSQPWRTGAPAYTRGGFRSQADTLLRRLAAVMEERDGPKR